MSDDLATNANASEQPMPEPLPRPLGVIAVSGPDAATFLRAQLTNDVLRLGTDRHFLAAWCDPKGRVLMLARVAWINDRYLLLLPADLIAGLMKRLRMYVLRAKVELTDASDEFALFGALGDDNLPTVNTTIPWGNGHALGLPTSGDMPRALLVLPAGSDQPADTLALDDARWQLSDIDAGVAQVGPALQNEFVPQMLNLHWLMAVDFDKGCYPGQEIVARLHYRGRLTRRVFRLQWNGAMPATGAAVIAGDEQNAGTVLQAAATGPDTGRLLAVLKVSTAADNDLHCDNSQLALLELPYATPD